MLLQQFLPVHTSDLKRVLHLSLLHCIVKYCSLS